jgi:hypothetical protein
MGLSDVGTFAVIGGVLAETGRRIAALLGREWADAWREGMFVSGLVALVIWTFRKLVALT